jgi:DNA-binding response OmpR family regulator
MPTGTARSADSSTALAWLEKNTPDLAVICTMLNDGSSREIAAELTRRGVPFIIYSGSRPDDDASRDFSDAIWVEKPATNELLLDTLSSLQAKLRHE